VSREDDEPRDDVPTRDTAADAPGDDAATEEELRAAEALARALDEGPGEGLGEDDHDLPPGALVLGEAVAPYGRGAASGDGLVRTPRPGEPATADDALEAAAFLRWASGRGDLSAARRAAVRAALWDAPPGVAGPTRLSDSRRARRRRPWRWLAPLGGLAAAAAVALLVLAGPGPGPGPGTPPSLPAPSRELLTVQLAAAAPGEAGLRALAESMRPYRGEVLAALRGRYEGQP
jgi:hypothetical protein